MKHNIQITSFNSFLLTFIIIVLQSITLFPQNTASLKGQVIDAITKDPLPGANILIVGTSIGSASDIYGNFLMRNLPVGDLTIRVSYIGYRTLETKITTLAARTIETNFELTFQSILEEEVVVTAQARGQVAAINQQLSADAIVNIVSSARIQDIPDANAAESVGRLPGVSILRQGGEGNKVVIRGLAPKYNSIQVAGIKMASTDTDNRSVDLSMISPYMLEGIEVIKAITPDMDADALGGTVNFRLREAQRGWRYDLLLQGGYNGLKSTLSDYKIVGSGSNRFFNDRMGVFAQIDIDRRNRSAHNMGSSYSLNAPKIDQENQVFINSLNLSDVIRYNNRYGGTVVLDYRIPSGSIKLNNFFSLGKTETESRNESYTVELNTRSYSTSISERNLNVFVNSLKYDQDLSFITIDAQLSNSYSEQKVPDNLSFTFQEANALANVDRSTSPYELPNYARNNLNNTFITDVFRSTSFSKDRETVASLNLSRKFQIFDKLSTGLKVGAKYGIKDKFYDYNAKGGFLNSGSGQDARDAILNAYPWMKDVVSSGSINLPYILFMDKNYKSGSFLKGRYAPGPPADVDLMYGIVNILEGLGLDREAYRHYDFSSTTNDYSGNEYYKAGFAMTEIQYSTLLRIIAGFRYEELKRTYTAVNGNSTVGIAQINYKHWDTTTTITHHNILPIVHLKVQPVKWFDVRFAYTNTLSRPDFNTITPRYNIGFEGIAWNNYKLKPAHSENFDLYLSFHENRIGLFTVGAFTKRINDMIFASNGKILLDPSEIGMTPSEKGKALFTYLNNPNPAKLWGIELSWQTNFWYLPGFLKGFVLDVNYTHIKSEAKYPRTIVESQVLMEPPWIVQTEIDTFYTARMISQPNGIFNVSLGYDYKDFSIRGSILYQSDIFIAANFWPELRVNTDDFLRWDLSIKQELLWEGFQVYLNVTNISGSMDRNLNSGSGFPTLEQYYGRGADLGVRYRIR